MFSNKNNNLIKNQNVGQPEMNMPLNMPLNMPPNMLPNMMPDMPQNMPPSMLPNMMPQNMPDMPPNMLHDTTKETAESFSESYPNLDYLYDNITSQENQNNIKTYICAFTINKELNTHFVKYIVEQKESIVSLPFFQFTSEPPQQMQPPLQQPLIQEPPFQEPPLQQPLIQEPPLQQPLIQEPPLQQPPLQQPPLQQPLIQEPPLQEPPLQQPLIQEPPQQMQQQPPFQEPPQQMQPLIQQPPQQMQQQPPLQQQQQPPQQMFGGFKDDSNNEEELDILFKSKTIELVKSMYQNNAPEPIYIGYIPNVSENNAIFVFVQIENPELLNLNYIECIPNELVFLSKVYNFDIEQPIKSLFANNPWLYMNQSLASPFSGYLCKKNEQNQIINVKKEEITTTNLYDQYLINIDELGSYYYFSFLPFDLQNTELYQRFALFPNEYDCILDNDNLEYYKQNRINFENSDSIYFKGDLLTDRKDGQPFFAIKTPLQFTKI